MNCCEKYFEMLNLLADGELPESDAEELMEHLDTCPDCRRIYEGIMFISETVQEDVEEVPDGLHEKIMAGVKQASRAKRRRRMTTWAGSMAACLVVLIGAGTILFAPKGAKSAASTGFAAPEAPMMMAETAAAADSDYGVEFEEAAPEAMEPMEMPYGAEEKNIPTSARGALMETTAEEFFEPVSIDNMDSLVTFVDSLLKGNEDALDTEIIFMGNEMTFTMAEGELECSAGGESARISTAEDIIKFVEELKWVSQ